MRENARLVARSQSLIIFLMRKLKQKSLNLKKDLISFLFYVQNARGSMQNVSFWDLGALRTE